MEKQALFSVDKVSVCGHRGKVGVRKKNPPVNVMHV